MQFLFEEIKKAAEDKSLSKEERRDFDFRRYLIATRVFADKERSPQAIDEEGESSKRPNKKHKASVDRDLILGQGTRSCW